MSIKAALTAIVENVEVRTDKRGREYVAITAIETKDDDEKLWITTWSKVADLCATLKPGAQIAVQGTIKLRRWQKNGADRSALSITASQIEVLFEKQGTLVLDETEVKTAIAHPAAKMVSAQFPAAKITRVTDERTGATWTPGPVGTTLNDRLDCFAAG